MARHVYLRACGSLFVNTRLTFGLRRFKLNPAVKADTSHGVKRPFFQILSAVWLTFSAAAVSGDDHPHRTITISGHCHSCDLAHENLFGAEIMGAVFIEANLNETRLNRSVLVETRFLESELNQTDFRQARLSGVLFQESSLHNAIFNQVHAERVRFDGSELIDAELNDAVLVLANFMSADLSGANFIGSRLFHARFDGAELDRTDFTRARLPRANLRGIHGENAKFIEADLRGADLSDAYLISVDFTGAALHGARLADTVIVNAIGLTSDALQGACQTEDSELPQGIQLDTCHAQLQRNVQRPARPTVRFTVNTNGVEREIALTPDRSEAVRLEMIRAEQARVIAEFEAMRGALATSREAVAEARTMAREAEADLRVDIQAEIEAEIRRSAEIESQLRESEATLIEALNDNEDVLRLIRESGERLVFIDGQGTAGTVSDGPSIIVDGNRYQLNGRYEWVVDIPMWSSQPSGPKSPPEPEITPEPAAEPDQPD